MNKTELIDLVALSADISKASAGRCVDTMIEGISQALAQGENVTLVGLGTFSVKQRVARTGRNPHTGETIHIAASKLPAFKAGKALKDVVN